MAQVLSRVNRPALVMVHNKTLAAQLFQEFRRFFPRNAVEFFVSYYDYYQPEAYMPATDSYIEKEAIINEEIDRLRLSATRSLFERRDVVIVASVSCIYGLGSPEAYYGLVVAARKGPADGSRPDPPQAGRDPVRAQRPRVRARHVPRARRHHRGLPVVRRRRPAHRVVRRRDRRDRLVRSADGPRSPPPRSDLGLSEVALRHAAGADDVCDAGDQGRAHRPARRARRRRAGPRSAAAAPAHDVRSRDDQGDRLLPRDRELLAAPVRPARRASRRRRCSTICPATR